MRGFDGSEGARAEPITRGPGMHEERRATRNGLVAVGTLACRRCDAPVAPALPSMSPADELSCPYCDHRATVREFLSLSVPSRPARVHVRVANRP
jgi:DNA-directed RNA polymerase subunit RPC12/RpoP